MGRRRTRLAILGIGALAATGFFVGPRSAGAHDCVVAGTSVTTVATDPDCATFANPTTTTHQCTGTEGGALTVFVCTHVG